MKNKLRQIIKETIETIEQSTERLELGEDSVDGVLEITIINNVVFIDFLNWQTNNEDAFRGNISINGYNGVRLRLVKFLNDNIKIEYHKEILNYIDNKIKSI